MEVSELLGRTAVVAGVDSSEVEFLRREVLKLLEDRGVKAPEPAEFLDACEHVALLWGVIDDRWSTFAKVLLLLRIYGEAGREFRGLSSVEEVLTYQAVRLLYARYLLRDDEGRVREVPEDVFRRTACFVATAESRYGSNPEFFSREFLRLMSELRFIPNSPTLMNAGTRRHQLAACFVVPVEDDTGAILDALRVTAMIMKTGAGAGFDFSRLRPKGDVIAGTGGRSSGPVSFMRLFDVLTDVIKEGGKRRGAMMAVLHDWHPDVSDFVMSKCGPHRVFENFNLSVGIHDSLMNAVNFRNEWRLYNPRTCSEVRDPLSTDLERAERVCRSWAIVDANEVLDRIVECAWRSGDPGAVFIDRLNEHNPTPHLGRIHAVNPCGETPLLDWEACNLGSINLVKYVESGRIRWEDLARDVRLAIRFLDDVIDMSWYPDPRIEEAVLKTRKVGLGVMGLADMLTELEIPYDSHDALYLADRVMEFIAYHARAESNELARERSPYPEFPRSIHAKGRFNWEPQVPAREIYDLSAVSAEAKKIADERPEPDWGALRREMREGTRNATVTTIAPTGSISIIANVTSSIEPFFALVYVREVTIGRFLEVNKYLKQVLKQEGVLSRDKLLEVAKAGGTARVAWMPKKWRRLLKTAHDINPEWHVRIQAVFQRWVDNAVSKTVNLRHDAPVEAVAEVFKLAWRLGCKGITVFRDRSKPEQVVVGGDEISEVLRSVPEPSRTKDRSYHKWFRIGKEELAAAPEDYSGGCPSCDL